MFHEAGKNFHFYKRVERQKILDVPMITPAGLQDKKEITIEDG
jgi:hypothetical protein